MSSPIPSGLGWTAAGRLQAWTPRAGKIRETLQAHVRPKVTVSPVSSIIGMAASTCQQASLNSPSRNGRVSAGLQEAIGLGGVPLRFINHNSAAAASRHGPSAWLVTNSLYHSRVLSN